MEGDMCSYYAGMNVFAVIVAVFCRFVLLYAKGPLVN